MTSEPMASLPGDDVAVSLEEHVGIVEIRRPPDNFFDVALLAAVAEGFGRLVTEPACRAIVLAAGPAGPASRRGRCARKRDCGGRAAGGAGHARDDACGACRTGATADRT